MTLTTHATLGALVGAAIGSPLAAFLIGLLSHFLIDMIPHGDRELYTAHRTKRGQHRAYAFVTLDAICAIVVTAIIMASPVHAFGLSVALGILGSLTPDLLNGIYEAWRPRWLVRFNRFHFLFHNAISNRTGDVPLRYALLGQAVFVLIVTRWF